MEVNQINQLMLTMRRRGVKKLLIKKEGFEIQLELEDKPLALRGLDIMPDAIEENPLRGDFEKHRSSHSVTGFEAPKGFQTKEEAKEDTSLSLFVTSPMVGTIYHSPSPNDPQFVKVGDKVEKNSVVCIIEAMKVMNEVKAGVQGIVSEILVDNASPVEFGTKILRITPPS